MSRKEEFKLGEIGSRHRPRRKEFQLGEIGTKFQGVLKELFWSSFRSSFLNLHRFGRHKIKKVIVWYVYFEK